MKISEIQVGKVYIGNGKNPRLRRVVEIIPGKHCGPSDVRYSIVQQSASGCRVIEYICYLYSFALWAKREANLHDMISKSCPPLREELQPMDTMIQETKPETRQCPKPINGRVIVKEIEGNETSSGIVLPGKKDAFRRGIVTAISDGKITETGALIPHRVAVGDLVAFADNINGLLAVDEAGEDKHLVLQEGNIVAVLRSANVV